MSDSYEDKDKQPPEMQAGEKDIIPDTAVGMERHGVPVVILAGGKCKPDLEQAAHVTNKALVSLDGRPMLSYVLDALANARLVTGMLMVGGPELDEINAGIRRVDGTDTFLGNIKAGASALGGRGKMLFSSSDIPLITAKHVDAFIEHALDADADLCFPIIPKEDNEARFPDMKRTYVKLRDGTFTGGNMMLIDAEFLLRNEEIITRAYNARKSPIQLASLLGFGLLINLVTGRATIRQAEERASQMLNGKLQAIITHFPEIGADVDKPEDIPAAVRYLRGSREI